MRVQFILSEIGTSLRRNLTMTIAVVITVAISLALFGTGLLITKQVDTMKGFWFDKVEVSVFLCGESSQSGNCGGSSVTDEQRRALQADLEAMPEVQRVFYESQAQAYAQFREQFKDSPDLVENVTADALPESFRVKLKDPKQFEVVASAFQERPGVEQVEDQGNLLRDFFSFLDGLSGLAILTSIAALLTAALLISNTIRVAAFNRRRETGIMRLVGASNTFIRLPFLLEACLAGLVGASLASLVLVLLQHVVINGNMVYLLDALPKLEFSQGLRETFPVIAFVGWRDVFVILPWLYVVGVLLAVVAALITLQRHLRV
jgi:cell division transport system permease protein